MVVCVELYATAIAIYFSLKYQFLYNHYRPSHIRIYVNMLLSNMCRNCACDVQKSIVSLPNVIIACYDANSQSKWTFINK